MEQKSEEIELKLCPLEIKLTPCPFCGCKPVICFSGDIVRIECLYCAASVKSENIYMAVDHWNMRDLGLLDDLKNDV
jgi:hypothetical protein